MAIFKPIGLIGLFSLLLTGCFSTNMEYRIYSPDRKVPIDSYDQSIENHIKYLEKGPEVEGSDCESAIFGLIPLPPSMKIMPDQEKAFANAIMQAGPRYNSLINVKSSITQYLVPPPLLRVICWQISGIAVSDQPFFSGNHRDGNIKRYQMEQEILKARSANSPKTD